MRRLPAPRQELLGAGERYKRGFLHTLGTPDEPHICAPVRGVGKTGGLRAGSVLNAES